MSTLSQLYSNYPVVQEHLTNSTAASIQIEKRIGCELIDTKGVHYLDAYASGGANYFGFSNPYIEKQIALLTRHDKQVLNDLLLDRLQGLSPERLDEIHLFNQPRQAFAFLLESLCYYWNLVEGSRLRIALLEGARHQGLIDWAIENNLLDQEGIVYIPLPDNQSPEEWYNGLEKKNSESPIHAFLFEPFSTYWTSVVSYPPALVDQLISSCQKANILCVADERLSGFGRLGYDWFASKILTQTPDILWGFFGSCAPSRASSFLIYSQKLTGTSADRKEQWEYQNQESPMQPIRLAATLAALDLLLETCTFQKINWISRQHLGILEKFRQHPAVHHINAQGTILSVAIQVKNSEDDLTKFEAEIRYFFLDKGIALEPRSNRIYFIPPYVISSEQLQTFYYALEAALDTFALKNS